MSDKPQTLNDALTAAIVSKQNGSDGEASLLDRIEAATYGGEQPQEPAEVEANEETAEAPTEEEASEPTDAEDSEEVAESDDNDEAEEEQDTDEPEAEAEDAVELTSDQLASILGVKEDEVQVDDEGGVLIRTKIDGEVSFVPLESLKASYQMENHLQGRIQKAAEAEKEFKATQAAETEKLQQTVTDATALVMAMEQQLTSSVSESQLEQLRTTNPGEYAALKQDIEARKQYIDQQKQALRGVMEQQQAKAQEEAAQRLQEHNLRETEALISAIPAWADKDVAAKEVDQLRTAVAEAYGFTPEEFDSVSDHRVVLALRDALKGRAVSDPEPVKKKLKVVPKITKPGARKTKPKSVEAKKAEAKRNQLRKTGSTKDAASLLMDII